MLGSMERRYLIRSANLLFISTITLIGCGLLMVFSSSANFEPERGIFYYFGKQLVWCEIGMAGFLFVLRTNYRCLQKHSLFLLVASIFLLFLTLFSEPIKGSKRWLSFGSFYIQPAEIVKVFLVLYLSSFLAKRRDMSLRAIFSLLLILFVIIGILALQSHCGMAIFISLLCFSLFFVSKAIRMRYLFLILFLITVASTGMVASRSYSFERLKKFADGGGWQVKQSIIALGSGGLFGVGVGEGRQKLSFLPTPHTDFIASIIGEETGFLGLSGVLLLFLIFAYSGFSIAYRASSLSGSLLAFGLTFSIVFQALINFSVILGMLPTTGLPLPFISYGGSSLVGNLLSCGLIIRVARSEVSDAQNP
jgi:cell division protein FtsW